MISTKQTRAFTLIELVVVVSVLAILAGVLVPRVAGHIQIARDAQRLADLKTIRTAIDQFYQDRGHYPTVDGSKKDGGWDVSCDGSFLDELRVDGYLEETPLDPINDATYHYRYYVYPAGSYGCQGTSPFYVLGIRNFETPSFAARHRGFFRCGGRNWGTEFAYVTGGGASFRE